MSSGQVELISSFRYNVWKKNAAETLVFVFKKGARGTDATVVHPRTPKEFIQDFGARQAQISDWKEAPGKRFLLRIDSAQSKRIELGTVPLAQICEVGQGIIVYKTREDSKRNRYISDVQRPGLKKLFDTKSSVSRYGLEWGGSYLDYGTWLWRSREARFFEQPKILCVRLRNKSMSQKLVGVLDEDGYFNRDNFNNIIPRDKQYSLKYVLGLFNSALLNHWYKSHFDNVNINPAQVALIPIRKINFANAAEKALHDRVVQHVARLQELDRKRRKAGTAHEVQVIDRLFKAEDAKLNALVYHLYGLTDEEGQALVNN